MSSHQPRTTLIHGHTIVDEHFWMRDRADPEVMRHLEAENAATATAMAHTQPLQEALYAEMLGRIKQTDLSVPSRIGRFYYYGRTEEGQQYPWMCRRAGSMEAPEEVLLDLNAMAAGHSYLGVGAYVVSDDAEWLAYSTDLTGYREYTLRVKHLVTGEVLPEAIERTGSVVWASDNRTVFYTSEEPVSKRSYRIYRHVVGTDVHDLVYEEKDEQYDLALGRSLDRQVLFFGAFAKTSTEQWFLRADDPTGEFRLIVPREPDHEYDADHYQGRLYIRTNRHARNFRVVSTPIESPGEASWVPFIEHNPAVRIGAVTFFARHSVVSEREDGLSHLRVIDMPTGASHRILMEEPDYALSLESNPEFETATVRYAYQSMVTPATVYDYGMDSRERTLLKRQEVLGGYDPSAYEATRVWATARDGTRVPISLVQRRDTPRDGSAPLLLYGYGSYGISLSPTFSSNRLSLLDRGVIYAIAYVRGGGELGEEWRDAGRMMRKMNTFHDFVDCAEFLVRERYTTSAGLVSQGGSAGGLLVCAAANLRPELFRAVVAQVPFVDVLNTMLDDTLPLTTSEYTEWGNPNEKTAFDYIRLYSPYENVAPQAYPAMLLHVSLNDSQVPYWEGAKLAARLRERMTNTAPVLVKANLGAGHGGASGRYDALRETAFTNAFVLWQMNRWQASPAAAAAPPA